MRTFYPSPGPRIRPQAAQQAGGDAAQGLLPVVVARTRRDQDRHRQPALAAAEQRHLVVGPARPGSPPALEVERPAARAHARYAPALRRDDRAEQAERVATVAPRQIAIDV